MTTRRTVSPSAAEEHATVTNAAATVAPTAGPALRLVVDGHRPGADHAAGAPLAPLHPHHAAPQADAVTTLERHGLRITIYADGTIAVAAPHVIDAPCEPLVDAHLIDAADVDLDIDHRPGHVDESDLPHHTDGRFVVRYEPPDASGPIARMVTHLRDRTRPSHHERATELHLVTERRVHIVDLSTWGLEHDAAEHLVDVAMRAAASPAPAHHDRATRTPHDDAARIAASPERDAVARRLHELAQLHDDDLITDEQYAHKRTQIIDSL